MSLYTPSEFEDVWKKEARKLGPEHQHILMDVYKKVEKKYACYKEGAGASTISVTFK